MNEYEIKRAKANHEAALRGKNLAKDLTDMVNVMGHNDPAEKAFVEELTQWSHRTLQQSAGGLMFKCIKAWAEAYDKGWYDGRNEYLCKCCADIVKQNPDLFEYGMPLV